jgi:protein-S-isoprenylcysteine O-methyltransferase Ste14
MQLKGFDTLKEKLPKYAGRRLIALGFLIITMGALGLTFLLWVDTMAKLYSQLPLLIIIEPFLPLIGILILELVAFGLIWGVWHNKERYLRESGELAYQRALPRGVVGVSFIVALCLHSYLPIDSFPIGPSANPLTSTLAESILLLLGMPFGIDLTLRILAGLSFLIIGMMTVRSAIQTFGIDYMGLVYLYFPEESKLQQYEIYSVLRHPTYFAVVCMATGGFMSRMSVFSFVFLLLLIIGLLAHIHFVEEKELIERFGKSFLEYRDRVPALHVRFRDLRTYFRFLTQRHE